MILLALSTRARSSSVESSCRSNMSLLLCSNVCIHSITGVTLICKSVAWLVMPASVMSRPVDLVPSLRIAFAQQKILAYDKRLYGNALVRQHAGRGESEA